eukprot:c21698_g1_i1 orf=586-1176(-)
MAQESWKREQDETGCQHSEGPILCVNNCGFLGSPATMNLCLKCYQDVVLKQAGACPPAACVEKSAVPTLGDKSLVFPTLIDKSGWDTPLNSVPTRIPEPVLGQEQEPPLVTPNDSFKQPGSRTAQHSHQNSRVSKRCFTCRKRVGLTEFKCRCGDTFCSLHRYSDKHNCSFDYKAAGRDAIAKANPLIKAQKVQKI